ncbi:transcription factor bHLH30-like [Syzygium oleosum]|uniref:transcription factor bHLH30-like n=1 Tax=Syzygium oleosum TaxID=219896 RepID=UPI0024BBD4B8|nr:transcription factor bHLH30-like [Syzygium oleosum]
MALYAPNSSFPHGSDFFNVFGAFPRDFGGINGVPRGGSLVLDSEKSELVKAPVGVAKKGVSQEKAVAAMKSHSEAERRRRERINSHLNTLRGLVPGTEKMDKAALLAEVVNQVKELKKNAIEASKGLLVPADADEITVEPCGDGARDDAFSFRASICCDYQPELLSDMRRSLQALPLKIVTAEISTLEGRLKNAFVFSSSAEEHKNSDSEACQSLMSSVRQALSSLLEKSSVLPEYSPRTTIPSKRRRLSSFDSSSSSS